MKLTVNSYPPVELGETSNIKLSFSSPPTDTPAPTGGEKQAWPEPPIGTGTYSALWVKAKAACDAHPLQPAELEDIMGHAEAFGADKENATLFGWAALRWVRRLLKDVLYSRMLNAGLLELHSTDEWPMPHAEAMMRVAGAEAARKQAETDATTLRARLQEETRAAAEAKGITVNDAEKAYLAEVHATLPVSMSDFLHEVLRRAAAEVNQAEREKLALHEAMRGLRSGVKEFRERVRYADAPDWLRKQMRADLLELLEGPALVKDLGADLTQFNETMAAALPLQGEAGEEVAGE